MISGAVAFIALTSQAQVAITPKQTTLIGPSGSSQMKIASPGRASISSETPQNLSSPEQRYKIISAVKIDGTWRIRIFDEQTKKVYAMHEGSSNASADIAVEKFNPDTQTADIKTQSGRFSIAMKVPAKVEALKKQPAKAKAQPPRKKDEMSFERSAAREATKPNVTLPKQK